MPSRGGSRLFWVNNPEVRDPRLFFQCEAARTNASTVDNVNRDVSFTHEVIEGLPRDHRACRRRAAAPVG